MVLHVTSRAAWVKHKQNYKVSYLVLIDKLCVVQQEKNVLKSVSLSPNNFGIVLNGSDVGMEVCSPNYKISEDDAC